MQPIPRASRHPRTALRHASSPVARAVMVALCGSATGALAQPAAAPTQSAPVVVTATRTEAVPFDVPASIDVIDSETIRNGRLQINFSDSLNAVPGIYARDRQNFAQDVQISVRGFGARSTFGIRGVRLYVDGIPATLPDGQGQITNVDLGSADRIEVLRGPFSALYGNSSGGVIQVFTEEGRGAPVVSTSFAGGSDGTVRLGVKATGSAGTLGYVVSASEFRTQGYREHSAATRRIGNAKLTWSPQEDSKFTLVANTISLPKAYDPLGLTRAQFEADPRSVDPAALAFNTRKTVEQTQLGAIWEQRLSAEHGLRVLVYGGRRETVQFQSIPTGPQASPTHAGGVIDLARNYAGADVRWTYRSRLADRPFSLVAGLAYDSLDEHRRGYQNFVGTTLGVRGPLRRDEKNRTSNLDPYVQGSWDLTERWSVNAGVRRASVRFRSSDCYVVGPNPDDSGSVRYSETLPVVGVMFKATDRVHLYATAGRGFETPTLNELSYRPSGGTGLNFDLNAARSNSVEAGVKLRDPQWGNVALAVFETRTKDEIVTQTNVGGRSTFTNAGSSRRRGFEAAWSRWFQNDVRAQLAYTWLDARYRDAFTTCNATPCPTPTFTVPAGNRIPGLARQSAYASLAWEPLQGWRGGVDARAFDRVFVNDANTDAAAGYATFGAYVGYVRRVGRWELGGFARIDNALDRDYIGSVIVNEGNSRFFEPAPGRTWAAGVSASLAF